jgi:hypothetical protein
MCLLSAVVYCFVPLLAVLLLGHENGEQGAAQANSASLVVLSMVAVL